ncbi:hypothetical protein Lnau_2572 [Legionella nautarum]|uniref:Uncharacterized protein n=1 Tax=Legionella nautarum TaxID=45070 RepID=A0A0W0WKS6_9GAMM|nr:hypothetical protein [Legionella nautarum]KTD32924.1 hypothetical protein Lnau_2572 [Legionella nautarum]
MKRNKAPKERTSKKQNLFRRFPIPEDREQYRRGVDAGRRAARLGYQKREYFNKKPPAYQEGYNETYDRVKATLSQAEIEANRKQENAAYRSYTEKKRKIKRIKVGEELPVQASGVLAQQEVRDKPIKFYQSTQENIPWGSLFSQMPKPQGSIYSTQGNHIGFFESENSLKQNNLELISENNSEEREELLEILQGENYLKQTDSDAVAGNNLEEEEELIEILKEFDLPNGQAEKGQNLTSFENSAMNSHRGFYEPVHSSLLEHSLFSPSTAENSSDNKKEMDNGSEFSLY